MNKIAIIGSGGLGREVLGIIESINKNKRVWDFVGFYDDNPVDKEINSHPVVGMIEDLKFSNEELSIVIAIGNPKIKNIVYNRIKDFKLAFPTIIHPSVIIYSPKNVILGKGVVIGANSVITTNVEIRDFVYINTSVTLSHDTFISEYCMLMPKVSISAGCFLGKNVYIGNGTIMDYFIELDNNVHIKAGSIFSK